MHRRLFLKALTAGTTLSVTGRSLATILHGYGAPAGEFPFSCLSNLSSARRIGQCFLHSTPDAPEEKEAAHYLRLLFDDLAACPTEGEPPDLANRLRTLVHRDYAEERIVCVNGWYLSLTEARLCAAVALS